MNADEAKKLSEDVVSKVRPFKKWLLLDKCHREVRRAAKRGHTSTHVKHSLMYKDRETLNAVVEELNKEGFYVDGWLHGTIFYIRWNT